MPVSDYALLFDTNVFNKMYAIGGEEYCESITSYISSIIDTNMTVWSLTTPFLVMESLGVKFKDIQHDLVLKQNLSIDPREIRLEVFNFSKNQYALDPNLSDVHFIDRYNRLHAHASVTGKKLLQDMILPRINAIGVDYLIHNLALDFQYGFPYSKKIKDKNDQKIVEIDYMIDLCRIVAAQRNFSPARGLFEAAENIKRREKNILHSLFLVLTQKNRLKLYGDRGDLDIIHLCVMGGFLNGINKKVLALTADDPSQVRNRIVGYKTMVHHFLMHISTIPNLPIEFASIALNQGKIIIIDPANGELKEVIEVESIEIHE